MTLSDEMLIENLKIGMTVSQIAKLCKVSQKSIYQRLSKPEMQRHLAEVRNEMLQTALFSLESEFGTAILCLDEVMRDSSANAQIRQQACGNIFSMYAVLRRESEELFTMKKQESSDSAKMKGTEK